MTERCDWLYARVLSKGNLIFPRQPYWLGWVEFTPPWLLDARVAGAVSVSLSRHSAPPLKEGDHKHVVARTLVLDSTREDAIAEGATRLQEGIDVLRTRVCPIPQEFVLSPAGALLDIVRDSASPLLPPGSGLPFTAAFLDDRAVHPPYTLNLLLTAPNAFGTLGAAHLRSLHWKQLAGKATTIAERILLFWMAAEALCSVTVGADPIPNLMHVAGFPIGRRVLLGRPLRATVRNHSTWTKRIQKLLEVTKRTRNSIVHEGHRDIDIRLQVPNSQERDVLLFLNTSTRCLHEHAESVLSFGTASLSKLWDKGLLSLETMRRNATWIVDHLEGKHGDYRL